MEPMLQKERGQETCNASFLTPLSAYILCTTLFFMQCSLPYLFSFVKRFFNFSSSHVAFCRQISCSHENLPAEGYRGSAALMSKNSCAAAENIADAFCEWRGGTGSHATRPYHAPGFSPAAPPSCTNSLRYVLSIPIAPIGAVTRIASTATESTSCPHGRPRLSGTDPIAAYTVAFGR